MSSPRVTLTTPRLVLRPLVPGDRAAFVAGWAAAADHLRPWLPAHLRRGHAAEAAAALLDHAFANDGLALHRVTAAIIPANTSSLKLAEKLGFRREGYARKMLKIADKWQDHVLLAKLAEEHVTGATRP